VTLDEKKLNFSAHGYGAKGQHNYGFVLDFHSSIDPKVRYAVHKHHCKSMKLHFFPLNTGIGTHRIELITINSMVP
jgi:hypothetical protein